MASGSTPVNAWPYPLETDTPDVAADIKQLALALDAISPFHPGDLKTSAIASAPTGWLTCDGSAISRSTFSALFSAIGTTYGVGDGSTTFNIPDYRGRVILGAGTGAGLTARSRGQTGGEEAHTLLPTEIPDHGHDTLGPGGTVPGITVGSGWSVVGVASGVSSAVLSTGTGGFSPGLTQGQVTSVMTNGSGVGIGTGTPGVANTHNNVQPYGVANVFIKT